MKKIKKTKLLKIEKLLYGSGIICFALLVVIKMLFGANIGNIQISIEKLDYQLSVQEKFNESLVMQINEITSFENIKSIVKEEGLAYNKDNIIVVNN